MSPDPHEPELSYCAAAGCTRAISPRRLFCGRHWRRIRPQLQHELVDAVVSRDAESIAALKGQAVAELGGPA